MRVLYLINGLGTGGAERSLAEFLPFATERGVHVQVVCRTPRWEGVQDIVERHGDVRFLASRTMAGALAELRRMVTDERPDLIHTTLFEADVLGRLAALGSRTPVLTSLVNTSYEPARLDDPNVRPLRLRAVRSVDGLTARHLVTHFHAITHAVKSSAVTHLGIDPARVTVIERGRDPERLGVPSRRRRAEARRMLDLPTDADVIVAVGRQEYQKGQWVLLEALPAILARRPRATTLIAGRKGHATDRLEAIVRRDGLADRVRFLGHRSDVPEILAAADVFVLPSLYEGLGGAVLEAMALGLPIVASRLPAVAEVTEEGENALLCRPGDPTALAAAVTSLLDDRSTADRFGLRSRALFLERFTLTNSAEQMLRLYEFLVPRASTASEASPIAS